MDFKTFGNFKKGSNSQTSKLIAVKPFLYNIKKILTPTSIIIVFLSRFFKDYITQKIKSFPSINIEKNKSQIMTPTRIFRKNDLNIKQSTLKTGCWSDGSAFAVSRRLSPVFLPLLRFKPFHVPFVERPKRTVPVWIWSRPRPGSHRNFIFSVCFYDKIFENKKKTGAGADFNILIKARVFWFFYLFIAFPCKV